MDQPPYAEYPRPSIPPGSFGRGPGVYFDAIGESWGIVKQDLGTWVAASLVVIVLSIVVVLPVLPIFLPAFLAAQNNPGSAAFGTIIVSELILFALLMTAQQFLLAGMVGMAVRKLRGEAIEIGMIFEPFRSFGAVLGASLLFFVVYLASFACCFLPVLFFAPVLLLAPTVALVRRVGAFDAISITFDACKAHWAGLLALLFVMNLIVSLSTWLCFIPVLITFPMLVVVLAIHYRAFFESPQASVPMA